MKKLDFFWSSNPDWWEWKPNGTRIIKPDAPEEAQESFRRYLEQTSGENAKSL